MQYGYFMMPMHPPGSDLGVTLQTDLFQIERLDELGFGEAQISLDAVDTVPTPDPRIRKHVWLRPYQQPHPPIAVAGVTEKS